DDLRAFRNEIAPELEREYRPRAAAPPPQASWRDRIAAALPAPFLKIPLWIYAAPVLALLAVAAWITMPQRTPQPIANTPPTPYPPPTTKFASPTPEIAMAIIRLNDGGSSLALDAQGRLTGAAQWPSEYRQMAEDALSNQKAPKAALIAGLSRPGSPLMGGA